MRLRKFRLSTDVLQLGQRERFGHELERDCRVSGPGRQTIQRLADDVGVIEGQLRQAADTEPADLIGIRRRFRLDPVRRNQSVVGNRDHSFAGIPVGFAERVQLLQEDAANAGFLVELALRGCLEALVRLDESAWQRPFAPERFLRAPDQQNGESAASDREDDNVGRDGGMRAFVGVRHAGLFV